MDNIADLLARSLARVEPKRAARFAVELRWPELAGPMLAAHSRPRVAGKLLIIEVDDERWRLPFEELGPEILRKVRVVSREIYHIKVELARGPIHPPAPASRSDEIDRDESPEAPKPREIDVSPELEERLALIADPELRERIRSVAGHYLTEQRKRKR